MSVFVVAKDKREAMKGYQIEECVDLRTAQQVRDHVKPLVDEERWLIDTSYSNIGMEPWPDGQMKETPREWVEEEPA